MSHTDRAAWNSALAAYRKAEANLSAAYDAEDRAQEAYAEDPAYPAPVTYTKPNGTTLVLFAPSDVRRQYLLFGPGSRLEQQLLEAVRQRDEVVEELKAKHRLDDYRAASGAAAKASRSAFDTLMKTPAPDAVALADKIEAMTENDVDQAHIEALHADACRLAGKAVSHA